MISGEGRAITTSARTLRRCCDKPFRCCVTLTPLVVVVRRHVGSREHLDPVSPGTMAREGCRRTANRGWLASHASLNKSPDGVAVASCRAYVLGYDHARRPNRLLSRREAPGTPSE